MQDFTFGENAVQPYARFENAKPGHGSGAGYERWRSTEYSEHTAGSRREDVYVAHHRLLALLHPDLVDEPIEVAASIVGENDVHHRNGVKWDNRLERPEYEDDPERCDGPNLQLVEHSRHAEITQEQVRAWAADEKRERERHESGYVPEAMCEGCGEPTDTLATSPGFDGERCIECATAATDGEPIEL